MKKALFLILFFTFIFSWSQNHNPSFDVHIIDINYVPKVSHSKNDVKIGSTNTFYISINNIINSYKIYKVEKLYKNNYNIECNDLNLMVDLITSFSNVYSNIQNVETESTCKHLPNDFGKKGGTIEIQEELNYIRAPEAWCITKGSKDIIIGVSDTSVDPNHEDLEGKVKIISGKNRLTRGSQHGTRVSSVAAAHSNNNTGMSAIGYNSTLYNAVNSYVQGVDNLSTMPGVKVINTAWVSKSREKLYNKVVNKRGVVIVASAGNSNGPAAEMYAYPAAFKDVISVGSIAHEDNSWTDIWKNKFITQKDHHEILYKDKKWKDFKLITQQHNDSIDIVAPGFGIFLAGISKNVKYTRTSGTSYASPFVSGTIALMFDVNYCLTPKEVETILKLTAVKVDNLPQNKKYYGKLGAGKLDAYEAVKMAKDMADEFGTVEVKDRILYRWFYKLETAPYSIIMKNNDVTGNARLKFKARKSIALSSGKYYPQKGGKIHLSINKNLTLDNCSPKPSSLKTVIKDKENNVLFNVYPKTFDKYITISEKHNNKKTMSYIKICDALGRELYKTYVVNTNTYKLNTKKLEKGIYLLTIYSKNDTNLGTTRLVKD